MKTIQDRLVYWTIDANIPFTDDFAWDGDVEQAVVDIAMIRGAYDGDSGAGFGYRDREFHVTSKRVARDIVNTIKSLKDANVNVDFYPNSGNMVMYLIMCRAGWKEILMAIRHKGPYSRNDD